MKGIFVLSMLIPLAMICSCQKQDSAAEQQLVQRKIELEARQKELDERVNALDERMNALDEKVKELAERTNAIANTGTVPSGVQRQTSEPSQVNAETESNPPPLPADDVPAVIPDAAQLSAEKERITQERLSQRQRGPEELQRQRQGKWEVIQKWQMSGATVSPVPK